MKTAISIPDKVFESAEKLAQRLGKSRSQLYTQALHSYLEKNDDELVQEALDKVYGGSPSGVDSVLQTLQAKSLPKEQW
jgi:metal-responsive CopG/Arc/MetJ family transcriptional regulator